MKIAMMVRGYITAPGPPDVIYAPIPNSIKIAEGLAKAGHQVDFYGPVGTKLKANVKTLGLKPLARNSKEFEKLVTKPDLLAHYRPNLWDAYLATEMFERARKGQYDVLHFQHPEVALMLAGLYSEVPVVYTLNDPIYAWYKELFRMYPNPNQFFISISNAQRAAAPGLPYVGTVYHGLDTKDFPFSAKHDNYLLYAGRITPEKGVSEAISVAEKTGDKLLIIGPTYPDKIAYFKRHVQPRLNDKIQYLGYIEHDQLWKYYQKAKAFISALQWEEPFGLTFIEAMATGTPVVALKRGSAPEVIVDGKTGYLVNDLDGMAKAVKNIDKISRKATRDHIKKNFSIDKMLEGHEKAFTDAIKRTKAGLKPDAK